MQLSWSNQAGIAAALLKTYPEADRLALDHGLLLRMILALPEFKGGTMPPSPACLDHVLWTWMRLADSDLERTG